MTLKLGELNLRINRLWDSKKTIYITLEKIAKKEPYYRRKEDLNCLKFMLDAITEMKSKILKSI